MRLPPQTEEQLAESDELRLLVKQSIDRFNAMSPDEQRAMREAHAKSLRQSLEMVADDRTACFEELGRAQARNDALEAENKALRKALRDCVNFMENTESELGITLSSAGRARALLAKGDGK